MPSNRLVIMARLPLPGRVKTRLSPHLSAAAAAEFYRTLLDDCVAASVNRDWVTHIAIDTPEGLPYFEGRFPSIDHIFSQVGENLGQRMENVFADMFEHSGSVLMRSSDSPLLTPRLIGEGFARLKDGADAVISPDTSGGYALVGLHRPSPGLFRMEMSTESVLERTLQRLRESNLRVSMLDACPDVDTPQDLKRLVGDIGKTEYPRELCPLTATWLRDHYPRKSNRTRQP